MPRTNLFDFFIAPKGVVLNLQGCKRFFIVYKKIVEICILSVSDIDKININNIHPVKKTIDLFNNNLMYMLKRRDYNELYINV